MNIVWGVLQSVWVVALLVGFGFLIQSDVASRLGILGARPDLLLAALVLYARGSGPFAGTLMGFVIGLMQDGLTPDHVGLNAAILCTVGFACGHLREKLFWESPVSSGVILLFAVAGHDLIYLAVTSAGHWQAAARHFAVVSLPGAVYTALLIPLCAWALPRIVRGRS